MKVLKIIGWVLLALIVLITIWAYSNMRDKNSGYTLDLTIEAKQSNPLKVGFSALTITPQYFEYWHDADDNARYEPKKGDTYEDTNNNGRFDTYWIAGFGNRVATNGVHDDIWARTMVIDDGNTRLAIVALDVIGFFHPMVIEIRNMLPSEAGITYLSMSATHTHEAPDLMGLWGESPLKNGVDKDWREYVKKRVVQSVVEAVDAMRPATLRFSQNLTDGMVTLTDTREPYVYDHGLRMMQAVDKENGETLGTLIQWANHPETLWSRNLLITSDFPHFIREAVEQGVYHDGTLVEEGVGGVALYLNGAVGGLMTTHATTGVKDPFRDTTYVEPSFDKARAQGDTLGLLILRTMKTDPVEVEEAGIDLRVKTFTLPLDNPVFRLAAAIGVMETDMVGWMKKRTEAAVWSIGPASFLTVPGEIYPEIVNGGIDALPGRDFEIDVQETPPLRALMDREFRFVFGLTNDEVGYIIPKSQWDVKEPFVYREKPYYGESNSLGCNTAPLLYEELKNLINELPGAEPGVSQASLPATKNQFVVIAHRGDHKAAVENTLEAYEAAIRNGADYVEVDLRTSKDGVLVLHHDNTIDRTTGGSGEVKDLIWNELKKYHVPSFEDALKLCKDRINIYLDHKDADMAETLHLIKAYGMEKQIVIYINKTEDYYAWRRVAPQIPLITSTNARTREELLSFIDKYPVEVLDNITGKELIETANASNVSVWLDGKNESPVVWTEMINKGIQGIQTDKLKELQQFLKENASVPEVRTGVLERMTRQLPAAKLNRLDHSFVLDFITPEEKNIFAGRHWMFTVDKPAVVSVMRHKEQETVPFWLEEKGFIRTGKEVKNDNFTYEVWQKEYPAGIIELGVNGFDLHRTVYFVTIGPVKGEEMPVVSDVFPDKWERGTMRKGQFIYNDWDELVIREYPADMEGHILFTTVRGRARESAFVNSFRATDHSSSFSPDQVVLTWSADPTRTQSVQWRTNTSVSGSYVKYWLASSGEKEAKKQPASCRMLSDAYIHNDSKVYHWETTLSGLLPGQQYNYCIGTEKPSSETRLYSFRTAPGTPDPFCFFYLGDTHNKDIVKEVLHEASASYPDAAFLVHSGDHVDTGLFRDHWDRQFALGKGIFERIPYMPVLGNHDSQDGLPPVLYTQLFALPKNNSCGLSPERNYTFTYSNAQFFMIDVTGNVEHAACWLDNELSRSEHRWKIAVMHFPPYHADNSYTELREKWCALFDKYGVDLVLSGHIHQYIRSYPIYNGEPVPDRRGGTYYISSLAVNGGRERIPSEKYNEMYSDKGGLYQVIEINNDKLSFIAKDKDGNLIDRFEIEK